MIPERLTTSDGLSLYVRHWALPNPKAVVLVVHGLGEHIGRYEHVGAALNAAGYAAVGLDHRTHGNSEGQPRTYVLNLETFVTDFEKLWRAAQTAYPNTPIFILGHSMGGQIAVRFALRHQQHLQGLITTGVGLMAGASVPAIVLALGRRIAKLAPSIKVAGLDTKFLSRDPAVVAASRVDPLYDNNRLRAGMAFAVIGGGEEVLTRVHELTLPTLVMHGEGDQIVNPQASRDLYARLGSRDKTLKMYPVLYHEIMNEPEKAEVLGEITQWLAAH